MHESLIFFSRIKNFNVFYISLYSNVCYISIFFSILYTYVRYSRKHKNYFELRLKIWIFEHTGSYRTDCIIRSFYAERKRERELKADNTGLIPRPIPRYILIPRKARKWSVAVAFHKVIHKADLLILTRRKAHFDAKTRAAAIL